MNNLVKQLNNFHCKDKIVLSRRGIIEFYKEIREILFYDFYHQEFDENEANKLLEDAKSKYLNFAKISKNEDLFDKLNEFINELPHIKELLIDDVKALYKGDPSANSYCEVVLTYPGFVAISAYRIAHKLYTQDLKFPARVISEYAHSRTGVDINPGATIGRSFFIDHGTGIVIGETTIIGNNVKLLHFMVFPVKGFHNTNARQILPYYQVQFIIGFENLSMGKLKNFYMRYKTML